MVYWTLTKKKKKKKYKKEMSIDYVSRALVEMDMQQKQPRRNWTKSNV